MAEVYRHIERHAGPSTVVAASGIAFGARLAQERLGVPMATVHLQPSIIRSLVDSGHGGKRADFGIAADVVQARVLSPGRLAGHGSRAESARQRVSRDARPATGRSRHVSLDAFAAARHRLLPGMVRRAAARLAAAHASGGISALGHRAAWTMPPRMRRRFSRPARRLSSSRRARPARRCIGTSGNRWPPRASSACARCSSRTYPDQIPKRSSASRQGVRVSAIQRGAASRGAARLSRRDRDARADDQGRDSAPRGSQRTRSIRQRLSHRTARSGPQHSADRVSGHGVLPAQFASMLEMASSARDAATISRRVDSDAALTRACELIEGL